MTAVDDRPDVTVLPANHPKSPGRLEQTRRYGRCLPNWQNESITAAWLPTCDGAWCERNKEAGVWQHTPECDRRNRDGEYAQRAEQWSRSERAKPGRGSSARDERRIAEAEMWRDGHYDVPVWSGGFDREVADRQAAAGRGLEQWGENQ